MRECNKDYCQYHRSSTGKKDYLKCSNERKNMKYVFVTGGVVSGLGKGICAASLGRLLKQRGLRVKTRNSTPTSTSTRAL